MSFYGVLTALNVEDIPVILKRCANGWRRGVYKQYPQAWLAVADELEQFASDLAARIEELKKVEPKPKRRRVVL